MSLSSFAQQRLLTDKSRLRNASDKSSAPVNRLRKPQRFLDLLTLMWDELDIKSLANESTREDILFLAVHALDAGALPCLPCDSRTYQSTIANIDGGPLPPQTLASLSHLAVHTTGQHLRDLLTILSTSRAGQDCSTLYPAVHHFASAHAHMQAAQAGGAPDAFTFRSQVVAAKDFLLVELTHRAEGSLGAALGTVRNLTSEVFSGRIATDDALRLQLWHILIACAKWAPWLDARFGEPARMWLWETGRTLSPLVAESRNSSLTLAHRLAFKGALSSAILSTPGPLRETSSLAELRRDIASLELAELEDPTEERLFSPVEQERHLCAWLRSQERRSGRSASNRRWNGEVKYDERLITVNLGRDDLAENHQPADLVSSDLILEHLGPRGVLLDVYTGVAPQRGYHCASLLASNAGWDFEMLDQNVAGTFALDDSVDPDAKVVIDGLGLQVAEVRYRVQEPSGPRHVSRSGANTLDIMSRRIFGRIIKERLSWLRECGKDRLIIWPHGPMAYLPFHLLPLGEGIVADHWTVSLIPSLACLVRPSRPEGYVDRPTIGLAASPDGGVRFGLPSEPSLWNQVGEIAAASGHCRLLPLGEATPANIGSLFEEVRFMHLAAHATATDHAPAFNCLFFDQGDSRDGRLFAHDILRSDLRGVEMVTLSACETGLGRIDPAGNWRGLTPALLAAGVGCVVATLWPVEVDSASSFFRELYSRLGSGFSPIDSFSFAQHHTRQLYPRYRQWGAFVFLGSDGRR